MKKFPKCHADQASISLEYLMSIAAGEVVNVSLLRLDPIWDPLRNHPRFRRLIEEIAEQE